MFIKPWRYRVSNASKQKNLYTYTFYAIYIYLIYYYPLTQFSPPTYLLHTYLFVIPITTRFEKRLDQEKSCLCIITTPRPINTLEKLFERLRPVFPKQHLPIANRLLGLLARARKHLRLEDG